MSLKYQTKMRKLRVHQDVKAIMENEMAHEDEIQPRQMDEIVVTPEGVQGRYSSDKVNEAIGKQWGKRFSDPEVLDYNSKNYDGNSQKNVFRNRFVEEEGGGRGRWI